MQNISNTKTSLETDRTLIIQGEIYDIDCVKWSSGTGLYNPTYSYTTNTSNPVGSEKFINSGAVEGLEFYIREVELERKNYFQ